jgi:hypothetical protein
MHPVNLEKSASTSSNPKRRSCSVMAVTEVRDLIGHSVDDRGAEPANLPILGLVERRHTDEQHLPSCRSRAWLDQAVLPDLRLQHLAIDADLGESLRSVPVSTVEGLGEAERDLSAVKVTVSLSTTSKATLLTVAEIRKPQGPPSPPPLASWRLPQSTPDKAGDLQGWFIYGGRLEVMCSNLRPAKCAAERIATPNARNVPWRARMYPVRTGAITAASDNLGA